MAKEVKILKFRFSEHLQNHLKMLPSVYGNVFDFPEIEKELQNYLEDGYSVINMSYSASGDDHFFFVYLQK